MLIRVLATAPPPLVAAAVELGMMLVPILKGVEPRPVTIEECTAELQWIALSVAPIKKLLLPLQITPHFVPWTVLS